MKFSTVLLSAVGALAASTPSQCTKDATITELSGVTRLNECETIDAKITIEGDIGGVLDLSNVKEIKGELSLQNSSAVTNLNFPSLEKISGKLKINQYTQVFNIDFTKLEEIGTLELVSMPSLMGMNLNAGISKLKNLKISDTALYDLQGLLNVTDVDTLDLDNNKNISSIDLPLEQVGKELILSFNNDNCSVKLDSLEECYSLTIQDVEKLSLKKLKAVNQTFQLGFNFFESFTAPELQEVEGSLRIVANEQLTNITFPKLTTVGGELGFSNNTDLQDLGDAFPKLSDIKGAVNIAGDIGKFELPDLKQVAGTFKLESTNSDLDCSKALDKSKVKANDPVCTAPKKESTSSGSSSNGKGGSLSDKSDSGSGSDKKNAGNSLYASLVLLLSAVGGALMLLL